MGWCWWGSFGRPGGRAPVLAGGGGGWGGGGGRCRGGGGGWGGGGGGGGGGVGGGGGAVVIDSAGDAARNFFLQYLCAPIVGVCYVGYKVWFRTRIVRVGEMDVD